MGKRVPVTKFPLTKIKKIMQNDEDVGRVENNAMVLVSKCVELFIQDLGKKLTNVTQNRGSSVISSLDLKTLVMREEMFDFLREKMEVVSETKVKKRGRKPKQDENPKKKRENQKKTMDEEFGELESFEEESEETK